MIVFSTFDDEEKVEVIVRNAIDQKFAACANVLPLRSIYPYDTPEIISIKPNSINSKYLDWLNQTLL